MLHIEKNLQLILLAELSNAIMPFGSVDAMASTLVVSSGISPPQLVPCMTNLLFFS
jgi:hypothetical protein